MLEDIKEQTKKRYYITKTVSALAYDKHVLIGKLYCMYMEHDNKSIIVGKTM